MDKNLQTKKPKRHMFKAALLIIIVISLIGLIAVSATTNLLGNRHLDINQAKEKAIVISTDCKVVIIRSETILLAPEPGEFINSYEEGIKVKEGSLVGYMQTGEDGTTAVSSTPVYANAGGLIYYDIDGWEDAFDINDLANNDWSAVFTQLREDTRTVPADANTLGNLEKGHKIARIIDIFDNYHLCLYTDTDIEKYLQEEQMTLQLYGHKDQRTKVDIVEQSELGDAGVYILATINDPDDFLRSIRYSQAKILGQTISGIEISNEAFTEDEAGQLGVFINRKNYVTFVPVEILYSGEKASVVSGLEATDMIIGNPQFTHDGAKL